MTTISSTTPIAYTIIGGLMVWVATVVTMAAIG